MFRRTLVVALFVMLLGAAAGWAQFPVPVRAGDDSWVSPAAGTFVNFGANPIPAGFFGAGSNPFAGTVGFVGNPPIPTAPGGALGTADTLVSRLDNLSFLALGSLTTRIQIRALKLRSTAPITVTYGGGFTEQWNVQLTLSTVVMPQPIGNMVITLNCVNGGGTFTSNLPVVPRFIFTNVMTGIVVVLDCGTPGNGVCGPVTINANSCWSRPAPQGPAGPACVQPLPPGVQVDGNLDAAFDYVTIGRRDFIPGLQGCGPAGCNFCTSTESHPVGAQHQVISGGCQSPNPIAIATSTVRAGAQVIKCATPSFDLRQVAPLTNFKFSGPVVYELQNDSDAEPEPVDPTPIGNDGSQH